MSETLNGLASKCYVQLGLELEGFGEGKREVVGWAFDNELDEWFGKKKRG